MLIIRTQEEFDSLCNEFGDFRTTDDVVFECEIVTEGAIYSEKSISAGTSINAGESINAGTWIMAGWSIKSYGFDFIASIKMEYDICLTSGFIKIGCQEHDVEFWRNATKDWAYCVDGERGANFVKNKLPLIIAMVDEYNKRNNKNV